MINKEVASEIAIGIILLLAIAVGGIFYWQNNIDQQSINNVQKIKSDESQPKTIDMQKTEESNQAENEIQIPERLSGTGCYAKNADGSDNLYEFSKNFNLDNAAFKITYTNQAKGISFEIPYNPNWGNKDCKVKPYNEFIDSYGDLFLSFGKPRAWMSSQFRVSSKNIRTAEDIIAEQKNVGGEPNPNPRKMTIGQSTVVVYESYGMTTERIYEVIGKKYNYSFSYGEIGNINEKIAKELEKIIESVKFVDTATTEIANWQTYINDKYGFEFQYPNDWIREDISNGREILEFVKKTYLGTVLAVFVEEKSSNSLKKIAEDEIAKNSVSEYATNTANLYNMEDEFPNCPEKGPGDHVIKEFNGGIIYVLSGFADGERYNYIIKNKNGMLVKFSYGGNGASFEPDWCESEKVKKFEQILSTFKFTK